MPKVIGYGEDALTYWALTEKLECVLKELDKSEPQKCLVIYRPSFGRRGGPDRAEFGEFDAILATPHKIYLVESKWDRSREIKWDRARENGIIKLREEQELRHKIFDWYFKNCRENDFNNWQSFIEKHQNEFSEEFKGKKKKIVHQKRNRLENSQLWKNLKYIINQLCRYGRGIGNIILFFKIEGSNPHITIDSQDLDFQLVTVDYPKNMWVRLHNR